ncbi:hypothetical protein J1N35_025698 [Gossypium stocksii]|uniref:Uncharacterized protein n=1 Tax=Gossypium stocksii TaxID=47602 RepID=A0A9D3V7H8_9ROSI|nr:hypothetical protein J1N35_025698 [Gossypium stocksii]
MLDFNSLESNNELVWSSLLCGKSGNSNPSFINRSTLCMWARGLVRIGFDSKNYTTSAPSMLGSRGRSISNSSSDSPQSAMYKVPSHVDVVGSTSSLLLDVS